MLTPIKAKPGRKLHPLEKQANRLLAGPRAKVEHLFAHSQMPIWLPQNPDSGLAQEHCTIENLVWLGQFVSAAQKIDATHAAELRPRGVVRPKFSDKANGKLNQAKKSIFSSKSEKICLILSVERQAFYKFGCGRF